MIHPDELPPLTGVRDPAAIHHWSMMASALRQALLMLAADLPGAAVHDLKLAMIRHSAGLEASRGASLGPIQRAAAVATAVAYLLDRGEPLTVSRTAELGQVAAMLSAWSGEVIGRHAAVLYPPTTPGEDEAATGAIQIVDVVS